MQSSARKCDKSHKTKAILIIQRTFIQVLFLFQPHVFLNSKEHLQQPMTRLNAVIHPDNITKISTISFSDNLLTKCLVIKIKTRILNLNKIRK